MKAKKKNLALDEAENKLLDIIAEHLATLPQEEAEKRIEKIHQVTRDNENRDTDSRSPEHRSTVATPLLARKQ